MKTRYNLSWIGFLSSLRTKEAHKTCQIRASSCKEGKNQILERFDKIWKRKYFAFKSISFFILFAPNSWSINTYCIHKDQKQNPSLLKQPLFSQIFFKVGKFEFDFPTSFKEFQAFHRVPGHPSNHSQPLHEAKSSQIEPSSSHRFGIFLISIFLFHALLTAFVCLYRFRTFIRSWMMHHMQA